MLFKIYRRGAPYLLWLLLENEQLSKTVYDKERERKRGKASQNRNRQSRMIYDLGDVAVCKTMFLQTLCVGEAFVRNALKKCDPQTGIVKDRKKQQQQQNKTDQRGRKWWHEDFDQKAHQKFPCNGVTIIRGNKVAERFQVQT